MDTCRFRRNRRTFGIARTRGWTRPILTAVLLLFLPGAGASAAVFPVSDAAGLIAAIDAANATPEVDVLRLEADVLLSSVHDVTDGPNGTPPVVTPIVLLGQGFTISRQDGSPAFRLFQVRGTFFGAGDLTLDGVVLRGGDAATGLTGPCFLELEACGGALLNRFGRVTIRRGSRFEANTAYGGGAVFNAGGTVTISDATFEANTATYGGAIFNAGGLIDDPATVEVLGSSFESNVTVLDGGAIHNEAELRVVDSTFLSNRVTGTPSSGGGGGAIYNQTFNGDVRIAGSLFTDNEALRGGALANFNASDMTLSNCDVTSNRALGFFGDGGGIWSDNNADLIVRGSRITENQTGSFGRGGGIFAGGGLNSALTLESSVVNHNEASRDGGGIYMNSGNAVVRSFIANSTIDFNTAHGDGGGIYKEGASPVTIVASSISDNFNDGFDGGGIAFVGSNVIPPEGLVILDSTIARNQLITGDGGGIFNENQGVITIRRSAIVDNSVTGVGGVSGLGGGVYSNSTNSVVTIENTTISGNYAQSSGGGTYNNNASVMTLRHVTITENVADLQGGGAFALATTNVESSILAGNVANHPVNPRQHNCGGLPIDVATLFVDLGHNFIDDAGGNACPASFELSASIRLGPLADHGGPTETHSLLPGSVAIDAAPGCALTVDQRGAPRDTSCDSGAYEGEVIVPRVRFVSASSAVDEDPGGSHDVQVLLDNRGGTIADGTVEVWVAVVGTAADGSDFALPTLPPLVFSGSTWPAPGTGTTLPLSLEIVRDFRLEGDETIRLELRDGGIVGPADLGTTPIHTVTVRDAVSDLRVEKSVELSLDGGAGGIADPGDELTYTVTVTNLGPTDAEDVTVEDVLDPTLLDVATAIVGASAGAWDPATGEWSVDGAGSGTGFDLASGQSETLTVSVRVLEGTEGADLPNTAALSAAFPARAADPDPANDRDSVFTPIFGCPAAPRSDCVAGFAKASLLVNEKAPGKEKIVARWTKGPALAQPDFGDPTIPGGSGHAACIYRDGTTLVASLIVERAGETCGARPCWKPLGAPPPGGKGFAYRDPTRAQDGVDLLKLKAGDAGSSKLILKAKNVAPRGQTSLPTGIAAALEGASGATIQLSSSDAACFTADLTTVIRSRPDLFKAR